MIRLDDVRERISERVPELEHSIGNAADWAVVVHEGHAPTVTPHAYVLFGGLRGMQPDAAAGMFRQGFNEITTVVLIERVDGDPLGDAAIDKVTPLVRKIAEAVAGFSPGNALGAYALEEAELIGAKDGQLVFHMDFSISDQLRITTT